MTPRLRGVAALMAGALLATLAAGLAAPSASARSGMAPGPFHATKTVTRTHVVAGASEVEDSRDVTVAVDKTTQLRGRERIHVSWTGAHPSGGRAANPLGEAGMAQEYPVVLLQCRGTDDPSLPADKQVSPDTCWTSTQQQRTQSATDSAAVWRHDQYGTDADRAQKSGPTPYPDATTCPDVPFLSTHITPFVSASGKTFASCSAETMAPEAAVGASYPPSEMSAFTGMDGSGDARFEVRTSIENESLGCNDKTACSLVVIPIMGISCLDDDIQCNQFGRFAPGSSNFANDGVDASVSPLFWWSASNWRNRISVPLSFGLPPDACDVLDSRPPTAFYGSELMSQAALQWAPAYCLRKDRFKFQHNRMSDAAAFALMENGQAPAAFVSGKRPVEGPDPVAYAPTAVTGFAVSYAIDRPDNAGELDHLDLTPRLLAKLLTQSYPASSMGQQHPGLATNPLSMNLDPEFQKLNPGLDTTAREAAATILSLSQSSDVVKTLTEYIAQDPEAAAFVAGKPDPWGMVVNPSYKGIALPVSEWPLKDTFVPTSELECLKQNPAVYLSQVAAPVSYLRTIAEAVLDAWPNVQTRCDRPTANDPYKLGRVDRQGVGTRFMLGVTSLGDAARFGLHTASLETTSGHFTAPTEASLAAAVRHATQPKPLQPFVLDQAALGKDPAAYPGTMVVYTAARTAGAPRAQAAQIAQFVRTSTGEGQRPGPGNGELPAGFLPIRSTGPTAALFRAAQQAGAAIGAQRSTVTPARPTSRRTSGGSGAGPVSSGSGPAASAPRDTASAKPAKAATSTPAKAVTTPAVALAAAAPTVATPAERSAVGAALLPLVLGVALLAGLLSGGLRLVRRGELRR